MPRRALIIAIAVLVLLGAWLLYAALSKPPLVIPPLPAADLEAMPPEAAELRVAGYWSQRLFAGGFDPGAWRRLDGPERQVWVLSTVEQGVFAYGLAGFLAQHAVQPKMPGLDDAREASAAMGLDRLADAWRDLARVAEGIAVPAVPADAPAQPVPDPPQAAAAVAAYRALRNAAATQARRRAYILEHRAALAGADGS